MAQYGKRGAPEKLKVEVKGNKEFADLLNFHRESENYLHRFKNKVGFSPDNSRSPLSHVMSKFRDSRSRSPGGSHMSTISMKGGFAFGANSK